MHPSQVKLNDVIKTYSETQSYCIKCHLTILHSALTKYSYKSPLVVIWQVSRSPWVTHLPVRHCWISFPVLVPGMSRMHNHLKCDGFQLSQYHHSWIWECQVPSRTGFCHCFFTCWLSTVLRPHISYTWDQRQRGPTNQAMARDSRLGTDISPLNFETDPQLLTWGCAYRGEGVKWKGTVERNTEHHIWSSVLPVFLWLSI